MNSRKEVQKEGQSVGDQAGSECGGDEQGSGGISFPFNRYQTTPSPPRALAFGAPGDDSAADRRFSWWGFGRHHGPERDNRSRLAEDHRDQSDRDGGEDSRHSLTSADRRRPVFIRRDLSPAG